MAQTKILYALGFFDGVHRGHQAIFAEVRRLAAQHHMRPGVFTYENHPQSVVGGSAPALLTTPAERRRLFAAQGMEEIVMIPFDCAFASRSPAAFVDLLVREYQCGGLCCGPNFRFGSHAAGDAAQLESLCAQRGLLHPVVEPVTLGSRYISSTLIRTLLREGEPQQARQCLGRPFSLRGPIVHGDGRGRRLGIPTINLTPPEGMLLPRAGVYATLTQLEGGPLYHSLTNVGVRPTFRTGGGATVETHITGFQGDVYGQWARVWFCAYLREEQKFENPALLVEQIANDQKRAAQLLAAYDRGDMDDLTE